MASEETKRVYTLAVEQELRVEVKEGVEVTVTLLDGFAEIFGTELSKGQKHVLNGVKFAIFTWRGGTVQLATTDGGALDDAVDALYTADETPMRSYLNTHDVIEQRRQESQQSGRQGPRTIVVGPTDSGKSTMCRILLNYAVRMGHAPTMIDLDVGQGGITIPGSIGATPVEMPIDIEEGLPVEVPIVHFYGHTSPDENPELYRFLVERQAGILERRTATSAEVRSAGMIINSMGWVDGLGYAVLVHSIEVLKADVILVLGQDKLCSQLINQFRDRKSIAVVKLSKSDGVVTRTQPLRKAARTRRVKEYFYGARNSLSPHSQTVRVSDLVVYRAGGGPRAPSSALPIGAVSKADPLRVVPVNVTNDLLNSVLAVSHAATPDELLSINVAGFVYVTAVDLGKGTLTYLAPCPGPLPGKFLLAGSLKVFFD